MSSLQRGTSVFRGLTIAIAGDSGEGWSEASIETWIKNEDGKFSSTVTDSVTHLLCTEEEFKKGKDRDAKVGQALRKSKRHVVDFRWLDLSIWSPNRKRLPERDFCLRKIQNAERLRAREAAREEKGQLEDMKGGVNSYLFHPYSDYTHFPYHFYLVRGEERYEFGLYESNAEPHLYQFGLAYRAKPRASLFYERKDPASSFEVQYDHFKKIFRKKTGINWDARLVTPFVDGEVNFCYTPPVRGKPVGHVPEEFMPHEDAEPAFEPNAAAQAAGDGSSSKPDNETSPELDTAAQVAEDGSSSMPNNEASPVSDTAADDDSSSKLDNETSLGSDTAAEATDDVNSSGPDNETTEAGPVDVQMADV